MAGAVETASLISMTNKRVQQMSIDGDEPPPNYIVKDRSGLIANLSPPLIQIPVIDISLLSASSKEGLLELDKLKAALTSLGCFQAIGHGISGSFLDKVREVAKQFFALPLEEKEKYARPANAMEGYGNEQILSDRQVLDWSDRLMLNVTPEDSRKLELWPSNPAEFREVLNEFSAKTKVIAHHLLKATARSLNLEQDCFLNQYVGREFLTAKFSYYPVCPRPDLVLGVKAHSDGSVITILLQGREVEGLQVFKDDQWFRVPIIPDALVVNAGDQLQIMSNGIFKSPLHRVSASSKKERISIGMFHLPTPEVEIEPAKGLINEKSPQQYKKLKNYGAIHYECSQKGKEPLETVRM